jgi:hypothetical protein
MPNFYKTSYLFSEAKSCNPVVSASKALLKLSLLPAFVLFGEEGDYLSSKLENFAAVLEKGKI